MITFNGCLEIKCNRTKAISFWSVCLPACETEQAPPQYLQWLEYDPDKPNTALQKLGSIVQELIPRYSVVEMYPTNGTSIDAHVTSLRLVMSLVTSS
jgi:hypothetical protein